MQFKEFDWLSGHGIWAIIPCPTNMVSVRENFWGAFLLVQSSFPRSWGVFNKTIIPLALVGYEMIIANSALRASLAIYHLISNARSWNNCSWTHEDKIHIHAQAYNILYLYFSGESDNEVNCKANCSTRKW